MTNESIGPILALLAIPGTIVALVCAVIYSAKKDCAKARAKREEDERILNAALEVEWKKPKTFIKIETFEGHHETVYFDPYIGYVGPARRRRQAIIPSYDRAKEVMEQSFARGYFVDYRGVHIPTRLLKRTTYEEKR